MNEIDDTYLKISGEKVWGQIGNTEKGGTVTLAATSEEGRERKKEEEEKKKTLCGREAKLEFTKLKFFRILRMLSDTLRSRIGIVMGLY
ncbi:hypothetical protein M5689_022405 [Euphorbia peplus]|nr:hypothetical protein M5689_022405 [Euphorbia peplus]